jgi:hypothetical protein
MADETTETELTTTEQMPPLPLVALTPVELAGAQASLIDWCDKKIAQMSEEIGLLRDGFNLAQQRKWKITGWANQVELAEQRMRFYGKVKFALDHGYLIIPDLPINVFAVRTNATEPPYHLYRRKPRINSTYSNDVLPEQLEVGAGEYKSPVPATTRTTKKERDYKGNEVDMEYFRTCALREMQFPVALAQAKVIDATHQAMALRVFDEVGLVGPPRKADPIVAGRILDPREHVTLHRGMTFFIAWWLRWEDL